MKFRSLLSLLLFVVILCSCGKQSDSLENTVVESIPQTTKAEITKETNETTSEETTTSPIKPITERINFLMFGVDTYGYTPVDVYRSDMIMCVSIDPDHKDIRFISILRDTKAPIEGHDPQKINAAYQFGKAPLAIQTVNSNFNTDFEDYITLDFSDMAMLVDAIGGVDVEISDQEADRINNYVKKDILDERCNYDFSDVQGGMAHLAGAQALMFSRIREIDSDYYRAGRQHRVLRAIIEKINSLPITEYPALIKTMVDTVDETSFTVEDILPWTVMGLQDYKISSYIIPDPDFEEGLWGGVDETGAWVWVYDFEAAGDRLNKILNREFNND